MSYDDIVFGDNRPNLNKLTTQIEDWAKDRWLDKGDPSKQVIKTFEEAGELAKAYIRNDKEELKDAYGDVFVTLVISAMQNGVDIRDCIGLAYEEISGRKGSIQNGSFIKEEDLQ